jgi:phage shock protein A
MASLENENKFNDFARRLDELVSVGTQVIKKAKDTKTKLTELRDEVSAALAGGNTTLAQSHVDEITAKITAFEAAADTI